MLSSDAYTQIVLTSIAILLALLVLRPSRELPVVQAQTERAAYYIEPSITSLRDPNGLADTQGKVVVDLRTGDIWGFPTSPTLPYPVDLNKSQPGISKPMYLGNFDFSAMKR